ncbi:AraC family transcriptional regulator [Sphingobacterium haloxyli]|uniref:AraC family transcriptional regulator n=1 Tax=Sphingobacterium haloxyli TaxID=2100533 RepID=A0A2S9J5X4_9SPHI|nr:AraC family transcriptional regulator [Sphingobacterium haloxyli]PRD48198.1 AraC family transcriptional regulator [Sphingobacterium haloxyli]
MKNYNKGTTSFYIFWLLVCNIGLRAQDLEAYNELYVKTYLETSQKDFPKALQIADSLYSISRTPLLQIRSLMLTASLYQQRAETIKSIEYALKAEKIVNDTDEVNWKARIYGFLATQYRIARLFTPAKEYIVKASAIAAQIKSPQIANTIRGLINQEMAHNEMANKRYTQAIAYIQQSEQYFESTTENRDFFTMENEQLLGLNYYLLEHYDKSIEHYQNALRISLNAPENYVTALIHNGLANIYLNRDNILKAEKHLDSAQRIADKSYYLQLKKEINETAYRYYVTTNNINKALAIKKLQDSIVAEIYKKSADFVNNSYTNLGLEREDQQRRSKSKTSFLIMGLLVVLPITLYFILPWFRQKQKLISKNVVHEKVQKPQFPLPDNAEEESDKDEPSGMENETSSIPVVISDQIVNKIMSRLEEFESKNLYVKRDISLSYLAIYCDTNTKYLSFVINSQKKKDFYNYINELRINYIAKRLINDPYYRRLKIAALTNEAGFSSQSKFAQNFKKVTGMSPSEFIKSIPEEPEK